MKLLFVNACMRGEESRTLKLCRKYIETFMTSKEDEEWVLEEVDLNETDVKMLDREMLLKRDRLMTEGNTDDSMFDLAKQLMSVDHVLIGAPYWDLAFPAKLKAYLEQCCVTGLTFIYNEKGIPEGQCQAKDLTYVTTSGGVNGDFNFGYDYIKGLCLLFGIGSTHFVAAEGLDIWGCDVDNVMAEAEKNITEIVNKL